MVPTPICINSHISHHPYFCFTFSGRPLDSEQQPQQKGNGGGGKARGGEEKNWRDQTRDTKIEFLGSWVSSNDNVCHQICSTSFKSILKSFPTSKFAQPTKKKLHYLHFSVISVNVAPQPPQPPRSLRTLHSPHCLHSASAASTPSPTSKFAQPPLNLF